MAKAVKKKRKTAVAKNKRKKGIDQIEVLITKTGRNSMRDEPNVFDRERKVFRSWDELKAWKKDTYGKSQGKPIYIDDKKGRPVKVGWIFGFWNQDVSHGGPKWFQQDWVEVREVRLSRPVLPKI